MESHILPAGVEILRRTVLVRLLAAMADAKEAAKSDGTDNHNKCNNGCSDSSGEVDVGSRRIG